MALGLSEEHLELAAAIRGWAQRHCPAEVIRAIADDDSDSPGRAGESIAAALAEQGVLSLHVPEEHGGQGYGLPELAVALEELGRALVPGAFLPTVLASAVLADALPADAGLADAGLADAGLADAGLADAGLADAGLADAGPTSAALTGAAVTDAAPAAGGGIAKLLAGLADGSATGAVALAAGLTGRTGPDGGLIVDGESGPVLGASLADLVVAGVQTEKGEVWAVIDAASLQIARLDSLDRTRPVARIHATGVTVPADRLLAGLDRGAVTSLAAILFGAEAAGIADWATTTAADYAKIRHQFGRPIGQFQAVKHRCAWMLTAAEQAAATVWDAARTLPDAVPQETPDETVDDTPAARQPAGRQREFAASVAAVVAIDAAVSCSHECIQVLGGIGYTWEHEAHLYYRRAMSLRALLGPSDEWARRVAKLAMSGTRRPVNVELPEAEAALRSAVRADLAEIAALTGAERTRRLAADGWVTPHLPRPWGRGASPLEQLVIDQEMRTAGVRAPSLVIGAWVVPALIKYGTPEQQQRFLPATLRGDYMWCQLFSEPGAGSDLAGLSTRAERAEGGWRLTGQKIWTSLAKQAAWAICIARTDPAAPRHAGITYFLLDMSAPGVEVRPLREITGDSLFNQVFLDDVFVPDDCVVGDVNGGWKIARTTLANERVSLSKSWTFGSGVSELLEVAGAAGQVPLGQVGVLASEGHAIDLLSVRVTLKQLSGTEPGATGSVRKLLGMRHAQRVAELCWSLSGADGALGGGAGTAVDASGRPDGAHWARQVLLTRALTIGGGTTDIQLNIIGERILGLPRDPDPPTA